MKCFCGEPRASNYLPYLRYLVYFSRTQFALFQSTLNLALSSFTIYVEQTGGGQQPLGLSSTNVAIVLIILDLCCLAYGWVKVHHTYACVHPGD